MTDRHEKPAPQTPRRKDQKSRAEIRRSYSAEIERLYRRIRRERERGEGIFADPWPPF
jgi:hypothetical protein